MAYFPLFVNLKHKEVLVIGGGNVAFQEMATFLTFEPKITLVAEEVEQNLEVLIGAYSSQVQYVRGKPSLELIQSLDCNPTLVIVTLDDVALNAEIYEYYREKNVLVEDISSRSRCDFIFPAIIKRGDVVCGISSSGKSPHVSQFIKTL
ncbi:MAG: bifunctional precorrin-2 dehydrogenase/sirohydrochlorin ferrochelatase, partial [Treponema sp.]|nr:bifunctional precorrin-2 dehydrogenase/sirohydrochlorin ferrochelatase [Treponema sp.]